ncbi:hypothetical protein RJ640_020710 [Escallonia rubra]|uniref:HMG box domain-containing protein n=1 Tax=Escallonia rubra TaxID=112253 RepID=A0AA88UP18_9ASTE|nr:hypothetical protein RJ640_020710 [Escallonia rubra]
MKGGKSNAGSTKAESKLSVKKGSAAAAKTKKSKRAKDPNKPKRPASAYFIFLEDFRKEYKEQHPNDRGVAAVGKAAGAKWQSLSDAEKAPYAAKAEKRKKEYNVVMAAYNKKLADGDDSDKSKSEVNDEAEGSGEEEEEE